MRGVVFYLPIDKAQSPVSGPAIAGSWWTIHPEKGVAFWAQLHGYARSEEPSPQCNQSEATARALTEKLWPDHEVRYLPVVFAAHAQREMQRLRANPDAGRP